MFDRSEFFIVSLGGSFDSESLAESGEVAGHRCSLATLMESCHLRKSTKMSLVPLFICPGLHAMCCSPEGMCVFFSGRDRRDLYVLCVPFFGERVVRG